MSKRVLILSGSPRKGGNSDVLCDAFAQGAEEAGHDVQKIRVCERRIGYCTGCYACKGNGVCAQRDDMAGILEAMLDADILVLATPVYFYTMDAQMKTLIDRTCSAYTHLSGKEFYFIMTAADGDAASLLPTLEGFRAFTSCLSGAVEKGVIWGAGVWQVGDVQGTAFMAQAHAMGRAV